MGLDYSISERIYNELPKITLKDIINFEKENIANKTFKYMILGNEKELDLKGIEQISPIKRVSTQEIFGY